MIKPFDANSELSDQVKELVTLGKYSLCRLENGEEILITPSSLENSKGLTYFLLEDGMIKLLNKKPKEKVIDYIKFEMPNTSKK